MTELLLRFLLGGIIISVFSVLGDIFRPKSFAGLFGAAPSVALATLLLTIMHNGRGYVAIEGRSMMLGATAFFFYASATSWVLMRYRPSSLVAAVALFPVWLGVSFGLWATFLR